MNNSRLNTCQGCGLRVKGWDGGRHATDYEFSEDPHQWLVMGIRMHLLSDDHGAVFWYFLHGEEGGWVWDS